MSGNSVAIRTMPSNPNSKVDFRDLELKNKISERYPEKSEGMMAKRDLKRYYQLIETTLKEVNLSYYEAKLIVHVFRDRDFKDEETLLPLQREILGAIEFEELEQRFPVNKQALTDKIKSWTLVQILAITDAVERYHNSNGLLDLYNIGLAK